MSSDFLPPNPCLIAILLVAKINWEPHIVFHYPPRPGEDNTRFTRYLAAQDKDREGSSSTDDDSSSSHDEELVDKEKLKDSKTGENTPELDVEEPGSVSPEKNDMWRAQYEKPKWYDFFGLGAFGLSRLLCPPSTSHKQRFEMSIDDKVFVGQPFYAREDEHWRKKKKEKKSRPRNSSADDAKANGQAKGAASQHTSAQETEESATASEHEDHSKSDTQSQGKSDLATNKDQPSKGHVPDPSPHKAQPKPKKKEFLNMFHVVFVLNPPPLEYQLRVKEMYDHVVRKFSKALRWEQAHSNLVLREATALLKEAPLMRRARGNVNHPFSYTIADDSKRMTSLWQPSTTGVCPGLHLLRQYLFCTIIFQSQELPRSVSPIPPRFLFRSRYPLPSLRCPDHCPLRCPVCG